MNNTAHNIILNDLQTVQHIPNPARRASLFVYMHGEHEIFDKYKEALDWGFSDPHPWVRRAAFLAFKDYPEQAARCFSDTFDRNSVIGVFDFIISAAPYLDPEFVLNYCHKYSLTSCEYASLQYAINFEKLVPETAPV